MSVVLQKTFEDNAGIVKFSPTNYKVSTITATGSINTCINLEKFYDHVEISSTDSEVTSFIYVEFGKKKSDTYFRGFNKKTLVSRRKKVEAKRFDNQATVLVRFFEESKPFQINMKVFKNGNVQLTGLKYIDQGIKIVDFLISQIKEMQKVNQIVDNLDAIENKNYRIRLINSDFKIGFEIKREKLFRLLQSQFNVYVSYEPCIYPGVKIQYFYNDVRHNKHGICECSIPCCGKGAGTQSGECKKITIAVFQSGCVIITGAQNHEQIIESYNFICDIVKNNKQEILKSALPLL